MLKIIENIFRGEKTAKEIFWSFSTKGVSIILFLAINIFLARSLGAESFGKWSLFLSVITLIFTLSYFGINASTRKFVAQYNKIDNLKNIFISAIKLRFVFSLLFSILLLILYKPLTLLLGVPELEILFLYGIPLVFFSGFVEFLKAVFIGLHRIKYNFFINTSEFGLKFLIIILFFLFSNSLINIVNSFSVSLFITTLLGFYLLYFNFYKELKRNNKNFLKDILNYSYPLIWISIGFIALTETDTIMIGILSNTSEVGIYAVAKQITLKLPHISLAIAMGTMPVFAKLNENNKNELKKKFYNLLKINSIIFSAIVLFILFFSPYVIPLIFGKEYFESILPLKILTIYLFGTSSSIFLSSFLDYIGKAKKRAFNITIAIILNIILNFLLIPEYGAVGAAIATSISWIPYVFLNWLEVRKTLNY